MSNLAVQAEDLGKQYQIGGLKETPERLGEQIGSFMTTPFQRIIKLLRGQASGAADLDETIWALRDVNFTIDHGEAIGIIGRNGAGKSTLLKILSKITDPTTGYVDIYGRVGSLLEVGTGFHPELTGRENVFLNGAILGMHREEIKRKFDEIVEFAEIDKFIETPVKHYSSGMYVRLAFSIAAHLEPEILLVDEVLAVGDVKFQRKCLGKMDDVAQEGRTVLFVSHNMGLVQTLCKRGIYIDQGQVHADGPITEAVNAYLQSIEEKGSQNLAERTDRRGHGKTKLVGIEIENGNGRGGSILKTGEPVKFTFHVDQQIPGMNMNFSIFDQIGQPVLQFRTKDRSPADLLDPNQSNTFVCDVDQFTVLPGRYRIDVGIVGDNLLQDYIEGASYIDIAEGFVGDRLEGQKGKFNVSIPHRWTLPDDD